MSDGNYNRNLLPYNNYQSGLKAGRAQLRTLALRAFDEWLNEHHSDADDARRAALRADFAKRLPAS